MNKLLKNISNNKVKWAVGGLVAYDFIQAIIFKKMYTDLYILLESKFHIINFMKAPPIIKKFKYYLKWIYENNEKLNEKEKNAINFLIKSMDILRKNISLNPYSKIQSIKIVKKVVMAIEDDLVEKYKKEKSEKYKKKESYFLILQKNLIKQRLQIP